MALASPSSLVIIVGRAPAQLDHAPNSVQVTSIARAVPGAIGDRNPGGLAYFPPNAGIQASGIDLILSVVALAMLAPVLIFIATATRLSAARREQRFAAIRLVGATRRQISLIAAVESTVAAVAGMAAGFGIFALLRHPVAGIPFLGQPFFPAALSLSRADIRAVAIGVPAAAVVAARLALRRVHISPLGVTRRAAPKPPRAWRVLPLLAGLAELGYFVIRGGQESVSEETEVMLSGFLLIIAGLVIAGPWLTMAAARIMARRTSRPGHADRRPPPGGRPEGRLPRRQRPGPGPVPHHRGGGGHHHPGCQGCDPVRQRRGDPRGDRSAGRPAVHHVDRRKRADGRPGAGGTRCCADPHLAIPATLVPSGSSIGGPGGPPAPIPAGIVSCAQLAAMPALGRCSAGATAAAFPAGGFLGVLNSSGLFDVNTAAITWPAAHLPAAGLDSLGVDAINVATNGSVSAIERARTMLESAPAYPAVDPPATLGDVVAQDHSANSA